MTQPLHIDTPHGSELPESRPERKKLTSKQKIALAAAALTLAAGVTGGAIVHALSQDQRPTAEAPANPNSATPAVAATETAPASQVETLPAVPSVENLEISAEQKPEQIASTIVDRIGTMLTTGLTYGVYEQWNTDFMEGGTETAPTTWSENYTAPYVDAYFTALCGPDYQSNPNVAAFIKQETAMTTGHLDTYLRTMTDDEPKTGLGVDGYPPYQYSFAYEKLLSAEDGTYVVDIHEMDNTHETSLSNTGGDKPSGDDHVILTCGTETAKDADGTSVVRVTSFSYVVKQSTAD
jgi:hypothetical protein